MRTRLQARRFPQQHALLRRLGPTSRRRTSLGEGAHLPREGGGRRARPGLPAQQSPSRLTPTSLTRSVTEFGSAFFQQTNNYLDGYPVEVFIVDGQSGTGDGSPNYSSGATRTRATQGFYSPPGSRMKAPGVPRVLGRPYSCPVPVGVGPRVRHRAHSTRAGNMPTTKGTRSIFPPNTSSTGSCSTTVRRPGT